MDRPSVTHLSLHPPTSEKLKAFKGAEILHTFWSHVVHFRSFNQKNAKPFTECLSEGEGEVGGGGWGEVEGGEGTKIW